MIPEQPPMNETPRQMWRRWMGTIFIPERHVGIVYRNGRFDRFLEPGYHSRLGIWDENLAGVLPITFHSTDQTIPIRSQDGFCFKVEVSTNFSFNPGWATTERQSMMAEIALRRDARQIAQRLMEREVESGLVLLGGEYSGEQLFGGSIRSQIEQKLRRHVKAVLSLSGMTLFEPSGLLLKRIEPPSALAQIHQTVYSRQQAVKVLTEITPELRPIDLLNQIIQQGKASVHMYDAHFSRTLHNFYAQIFAHMANEGAVHQGEFPTNHPSVASKATNGYQS